MYCMIMPCTGPLRDLHSFPTRRSSDLFGYQIEAAFEAGAEVYDFMAGAGKNSQYKASLANTQHEVVDLCRSEEHTSELQSRGHLVCRLLLEKKNTRQQQCIEDTDRIRA